MNKDFKTELNYCLVEQGFDWHSELDIIALALLGLLEFYKNDINKIIKDLKENEE